MRRGLHLDALLLAELRQGLLDAQRGEAGGAVGVPALPHDLGHHTQNLQTEEEAQVSGHSSSEHPGGLNRTDRSVVMVGAPCWEALNAGARVRHSCTSPPLSLHF